MTIEITESDLVDESEHDDDGLYHGAHTRCQFDAPRVTLLCGRTAAWTEHMETPTHEPCPICHPDDGIAICPVCGTRVVTA